MWKKSARIIPNRYSYKYKKVNDIFLKPVSTVPLSSSVPIYTKYKVEYKVYKKILIGKNKQ